MNKLVSGLQSESNKTYTENGMLALESTTSYLVNLFGIIGALRSRSNLEIETLFSRAFAEDKLLATKMAFYARDVRSGGLGERRTAKVIWTFLANNHTDVMRKNLEIVPLFGRWDDMYDFVDTPLENDMWAFLSKQIKKDLVDMKANKPISLLAKWLKSANTKVKATRELGKKTAKAFNISEREYRKMLSKMRKYLSVTEVFMSANNWDNINYSNVSSLAMNRYRTAFYRNDESRFETYISNVSNGVEKINSSTLFPYDIVEKYLYPNGMYSRGTNRVDAVLEEQWKALPNYLGGNDDNILIMADVSGSMSGRPMATSIGLATYFAERNKGCFHNLFMTFSTNPKLQELVGETLFEKVQNLRNAEWKMSTNIDKAFRLVLDTAVRNNVPASDIPKAIVIISDMEFDHCANMNTDFYTRIKNDFNSHGYEIPNIVFWNVDSRNDVFHANSEYVGVQLASGQSASTFKNVILNMGLTPYEAMENTLNNSVYDCVRV